MSETIDDVTIVGGGDSGLLTGLCIQKLNPDIDISIVDDFRRDVPQVGKSTYLKIWEILHETLDIGEDRFVSEVKPVWKVSVYFRDWCGYAPFHYPFDGTEKFPKSEAPNAIDRYYHFYEEGYDDPDHRTRCEQIADQGKSPWYFSTSGGGHHKYGNVAYHLNTERFNSFLREVCRERGVSLIDDEIVGVDVADGRVERVRSKSQTYESDLYVDASGFNRVVRGELDAEFRDFGFPLDSAFNARVENSLEDVVPATVIDSGEHGWFWQIDTYDNRDLGYVFASEFVDDEEAMATFLDHCDGDVSADDVDKYEFTSGYHERAWQGNCLSIGNAQGFVEPLQSTGLTANAQAAVTLSKLLSGHGRVDDDAIRDTYNTWVAESWESIYDFISVHYRFSDGDNEFWETMGSIDTSPRVERLVTEFDRNGFDTSVHPTSNLPDVVDPLIFRPRGFYLIMRNMGATSEFYESNDFDVSDAVERERDEYYRNVADEVKNHHTLREFYKGVLPQ